MSDRGRTAVLVSVVLLTAVNVHAEVMDKEPTLARIWTFALAFGVVGAAAWRWNRWAGAVVSLASVPFALSVCAEFMDPFVGPAILAEAGRMHIVLGCLAIVACGVLHVAGAWLGGRAHSARIERGSLNEAAR
jgi:hypothetical protein